MSKQQSTFDLKDMRNDAPGEYNGVLDQLDLPPKLIEFLQKNQRKIWTVAIIIAVVVTIFALYGSYSDYRLNKAAEAYDAALLFDGDQQKAALQKVTDDYSSTPSATWSQVELAHIDQAAGETKAAVSKLETLSSELSEKDLLKPLVLANLGGLYERDKQWDKAVSIYEQLKNTSGFEAMAQNSLGRVYESQGSNDKAIQAYQRYMSLTDKKSEGGGSAPGQNSPARNMVQASLNRLLK
jgi:predicted negative regulator of RcsB-dependent stress response